MKPPPRLPLRIFRSFCRPRLRDSIEGDLVELFYEREKAKGRRMAVLLLYRDVLLLFRKNIVRPIGGSKSNHHFFMYQRYFIVSWRGMLRQKLFSAVKIGGLALGIAACVLIGLFVRDEVQYDRFVPDADRVFRIVGVFNDNGDLKKGIHFQPPMARALAEDFQEIEQVGRYNNVELFGAARAEIRRADATENLYEEKITYFDQELLDILGLPFVYGNPRKALAQPQSIVMTRTKAEKYFPGTDPVGKLLIVNDDAEHPFVVGGVMEDWPATSHLQFDFLLTLTAKEFWKGEQASWCCSNYPMYVKLKAGTDPKDLSVRLTKVVLDKYIIPDMEQGGRTDAAEIRKNAWLELQPVTDIHLHSQDISGSGPDGDIRMVWLFSAVALFILLIASINFINLSTARSANRAKEVGLRKVVGSQRSELVGQFLSESILYSALSFIAGVALASALLPIFNNLADKTLTLPWTEFWFVPSLLSASLLVGFLAGIYPSLYLSSFRPIEVLRGNLSLGSNSKSLRSGLVVLQFTISIVLIVATLVVYRQMDFILNSKLGFNKDQVLVIQGTESLNKALPSFKQELRQLSGVRSVSIGDYLPVTGTKRNGNPFFLAGRSKEDKPVQGQFWQVDEHYLETMGIRLLDGRNFDPRLASDSTSVIINEQMAKQLSLAQPVGSAIENWRKWNVIGVVENFHYESLREAIAPLAMSFGNSTTMVTVKLEGTEAQEALPAIAALWKKFSPHQSFRYSFLDQNYARMYADVRRMATIFLCCAALALVVASLGLLALSAFMIEQRGKEISIRMVLGASVSQVVKLLTTNFLALVAISFVVAVPIAWYGMGLWLEDFAYKTELSWDIFAVAGLLSVLIALSTVLFQAARAAVGNPATRLRSDG